MNKLTSKEKKRKLPVLLGNDALRYIGIEKIKRRMQQGDENAIPASIVYSSPKLGITKHISEGLNNTLEEAGSIARSFSIDVIGFTYLLYALIEDKSITELLVKNKIDVSKLITVLNKNIEKGSVSDASLRKRQIRISEDVELLLKDSLEASKNSFTLIEPMHVIYTLVKKDTSKISEILREAEIDVSKLVRKIEDEIFKNR